MDRLKKLAAKEMAKRVFAKRANLALTSSLLSTLFPQQLAFATDTSQRAVARCSRQAGKSRTAATHLLTTSLAKPLSNCCYLALTRKSAKMILWSTLKYLCNTFKIYANFKEAELQVEFPNGSIIYLMGANDESVAETLRGTPWDLVYIDECASFRGHIEYLIEECISPAFITRNGLLRLIGTPSSDFTSYFYLADNTLPDWSRHHWNTTNNIYIPHAATYLEDVKTKRGWSDDNPVYLREWMGQWSRSIDDQVYAFNPLKNLTSSLPPSTFHYIIGVDIGWKDDTAIVVVAFNPEVSRNAYVVHQWKAPHTLISSLGEELKRLQEVYKPVATIMDEGGLGKSIAEELNNRYNLSIRPAEKTQKLAYIELLNSDLHNGYVQIVDDGTTGGALAEEWRNLTWAEKNRMEDPKQPNHLSDAILYSWRHCYSYLHTGEADNKKPTRYGMAGPTPWQDEEPESDEWLYQ